MNKGKDLEELVAFIEQTLLPKGFDVKTNTRRFSADGDMIAEFDIEITGKIGSTEFSWLIECRDRPSSGAAPASWIEQLAGREQMFHFSRVTAVSTTGFSTAAVQRAQHFGIELREVQALQPGEFHDWLAVRHLQQIRRQTLLRYVDFEIKDSTDTTLVEALREVLLRRAREPFLRGPTDSAYTVDKAFLNVVTSANLFEGIEPGAPPRAVNIHAQYSLPEDPLFAETSVGAVQIGSIRFQGDLIVTEEMVPLTSQKVYHIKEKPHSIDEIAIFEGDGTRLELHRIDGAEGLTVSLRRT